MILFLQATDHGRLCRGLVTDTLVRLEIVTRNSPLEGMGVTVIGRTVSGDWLPVGKHAA